MDKKIITLETGRATFETDSLQKPTAIDDIISWLTKEKGKGATHIRWHCWDGEELEITTYFCEQESDRDFENRKMEADRLEKQRAEAKLNADRIEYQKLKKIFEPDKV